MQTSFAICTAQGKMPNMYFGTLFDASSRNIGAWSKAYGEHLHGRYGQGIGLINRSILRSLDAAQAFAQNREDALRSKSKIVETGWRNE
jgi:hypothetical protein